MPDNVAGRITRRMKAEACALAALIGKTAIVGVFHGQDIDSPCGDSREDSYRVDCLSPHLGAHLGVVRVLVKPGVDSIGDGLALGGIAPRIAARAVGKQGDGVIFFKFTQSRPDRSASRSKVAWSMSRRAFVPCS